MKRLFLSDSYHSYDFVKIMEICRSSVRYFTLTIHNYDKKRINKTNYYNFLGKLKKFQLHQFVRYYRWFGYERRKVDFWDIYRLWTYRDKVIVYSVNSESIEVLKQHISDLFLDKASNKYDLPEDICFFREDQSLFLGTFTHGFVAEMYLTNQEEFKVGIPEGFNEHTNPQVFWNFWRVPLKKDEKPVLISQL
jgi:hypothetical protein